MPFEFQPVPLNMVPVRFPDRHGTSLSSHAVIRCHRPTSTSVSLTALEVRAGAVTSANQNPRRLVTSEGFLFKGSNAVRSPKEKL